MTVKYRYGTSEYAEDYAKGNILMLDNTPLSEVDLLVIVFVDYSFSDCIIMYDVSFWKISLCCKI